MSQLTASETGELSRNARFVVLLCAFLGLVFDGFELGLMPVASLSVTKSLLGADYTDAQGGVWFASFTAALMLGAAIGGSLLGNLGDKVGRARAMGISILCYSVFAGLGAVINSANQMLILRFLVGLGVGGMWPNGVALVAECWPNTSRPTVSGVLGAGINVGILALSLLGRNRISPESWRWLFSLSAIPAVLGIVVLTALPESPKWLAARGKIKASTPLRQLLRADLIRPTILGILLASIPLVGAWAGSKWVIPWADHVGGVSDSGYKSTTQFWWAVGAVIGSFLGAPMAGWIGRRMSYVLISVGATLLTWAMFRWTAPLESSFLPTVFGQGLVATLFFGWLPLYLPELFPVEVRATGAGVAMNIGRFITAVAVLYSGWLFTAFDNEYAAIGAACALIYALGAIVVIWAPNTEGRQL